MITKTLYICTFCKNEFYRYPSTVRNPNKVFCCKQHKSEYQKTSLLGENNPNFNHRWDCVLRSQQSARVKKEMEDPIRRYESGKANRGKKISSEIRERMSAGQKGRPSRSMLEETRQRIAIGSKQKYTPEYIEKFRKVMEERGIWIPRSQKEGYEVYFILSSWSKRMWDLVENENQIQLLKTYGVFNNKTNKKGVVRDHIFSRQSGYKLKVFPEILAHPMNCQIITHADNVRKKTYRYIDKDEQSLEELFTKIETYKRMWYNQANTLALITRFKNGERWVNPYKKEE
jgi:hypothetical protein